MSPTALSYADRAKRAQRSSLDNTVHAVSVSMSVSTASSSLSYSTPSSSSTSSTASNGTVISSDSTDVDTADTTAPTTSNSSVIVESDCEGNGEQKVQLKGKDREKEEIRSPTRKPTVNVWQQRMAEAKQLGAKRDSTPSSLTTPKPPTSSPPEVTDEDDDPFIVKVRPAPTSWSNRPSLASPSRPSGATKPSSEKPVPLDLKDSNAWPEVGVGLFSPNKSKGKGKLNNEEDGTVKENESPSKSIKVKSKSRWVAIPAEELQAAADAAAISRRQQARSQSVPKNSANNESQSHSRNQSHSRDSSLNRLPTSQKLARTGSKSVSRAGTSSGPHSRMHSRSTSAHESPAASREVGLPPQETEELTLVEEIRSHTTSSSHESTLRTSTYTVPSATSPLPSVFPVQIQQQQQQLKANTSVASGAATSFEAQSAYLPNGHFSTMEFTPASESAPPPQSPTTDQNLSHHPPPHPPSSHSPNMLSPAMMSYTPPYPFYSPYEYPSHPGMSHQMYWSSNGGSGHQTPNYGASQPTQHYMMPYGLPPQPPYAQPTHNPNYYSDGQHLQQYGHIPYPLPISAEDSSAMRPRVLFGSFDGDERDLPTASESRLSFSVGLGPGEESLSKPRTRKRTGKKCTRWQKTAGVMMLNSRRTIH
ncbi:hypothetical protein GYMLUDRAFT_544100 [Collybiopsis luxurians FD-317 M1]|nr:hypothetical protein GYMLUDRAFT_544100 [Collybiopsis luxurians FD-317 M1]